MLSNICCNDDDIPSCKLLISNAGLVQGWMLRTDSQMIAARQHELTEECLQAGWDVQPQCRAMALDAGFLDRYNLTITYNDNVSLSL